MSNRPRFPWITDAAIPLVIAGFGVMGFDWPYYAGPALIGLGAIIFIVRFALWLQAGRGERSGGYMKPLDVIMYMAGSSAWGERTRTFKQMRSDGTVWRKNSNLEAFLEFHRQAALPENDIRAFGLLRGCGSPVPIPASFWLTNGLDITETLSGRSKTSPYPAAGDVHHANLNTADFYTGVFIERRGVIRTWPRMSLPALIKKKIRHWREARELRDLPLSEPEALPQHEAEPEDPPAKRDSPNYPYRKAVLQMGKPITSGSANSSRVLEKTECTLVIRNEASVALKDCTVHFIDLRHGGQVQVLDRPLRKPFDVPAGGDRRFHFITRDLRDVVSNPPHLLRTEAGDVPLRDDHRYELRLELRSEYEFPTMVTLAIETDRQYAKATVESQTV